MTEILHSTFLHQEDHTIKEIQGTLFFSQQATKKKTKTDLHKSYEVIQIACILNTFNSMNLLSSYNKKPLSSCQRGLASIQGNGCLIEQSDYIKSSCQKHQIVSQRNSKQFLVCITVCMKVRSQCNWCTKKIFMCGHNTDTNLNICVYC